MTLIPGTLNLVILVSPKVISLDTVVELAAASCPNIKLLDPEVVVEPLSASDYNII